MVPAKDLASLSGWRLLSELTVDATIGRITRELDDGVAARLMALFRIVCCQRVWSVVHPRPARHGPIAGRQADFVRIRRPNVLRWSQERGHVSPRRCARGAHQPSTLPEHRLQIRPLLPPTCPPAVRQKWVGLQAAATLGVQTNPSGIHPCAAR